MTQLVNTRYGAMECLASDSMVSLSLSRYGEWAQHELDFLAPFIRPGMVVLDVGAFIGTHTLAFASMVGPHGAVHSFEPRAAIRALLERNVERNGYAQVRVHGCALGTSAASFEVPALNLDVEENFGGLALNDAAAAEGERETISIASLDELALGRVDLMKLDAEGMEADVLRGAAQTLRQYRPVLFAECNDLERGILTIQACRDYGYALFGAIFPAYNEHNLAGQTENVFGDGSEAALVAVPIERAVEFRQAGILSRLAPIETLDDLVLLMLHKPQYPLEVLARGAAGQVLGISYSSPVSRTLQDRVSEVEAALAGAYERAQEAQLEAKRARQVSAAVQALLEHSRAEEARSRRYERTSLLFWAAKLLRRADGGQAS